LGSGGLGSGEAGADALSPAEGGRKPRGKGLERNGIALDVMGLEQLDAFLTYARQRPELQRQLQDQSNPLDLADFLALARGAGFELIEADVIAAQVRQDEQLSDAELQGQAAREARRMRNFIRG